MVTAVDLRGGVGSTSQPTLKPTTGESSGATRKSSFMLTANPDDDEDVSSFSGSPAKSVSVDSPVKEKPTRTFEGPKSISGGPSFGAASDSTFRKVETVSGVQGKKSQGQFSSVWPGKSLHLFDS